MNPEIKAALEQVRKALSHPTREYRPADAALDLITAHLEAQEAQLAEVEDALMLACDVSGTMVDSLALARFGAIADEVKKRVADRPKKHKIGCGYRGTLYTGECRCFPTEAPHE